MWRTGLEHYFFFCLFGGFFLTEVFTNHLFLKSILFELVHVHSWYSTMLPVSLVKIQRGLQGKGVRPIMRRAYVCES